MKHTLKNITVSIAAVSVMSTQSFGVSIFGTSVDEATLEMQIVQNAEQVLQTAEMIKHTENLIKQVKAQTGIRDILAFREEMINLHKILKEYSVDFMDLTNDIVDHPRSQLGLYAKRLFERYNLFDDCNYDYMSDDEKRICKSEMVRNVQEIATYQYTTQRIKDIAANIKKLVQKRNASKDIKNSQDIANAIQGQIAQLELIKIQIEMMEAQNRAKERVDRRQAEQIMRSKRGKYVWE